ncbi:MAG: hypothetical protein JW732_05445 [Dehalococcoidia bacterium]|nr:hypothetical protein [Dehalococcoidia bacterium]
MKISRTSRWILTIGILAIILITLGVMYSRHKATQDELTANIAQAQQSFLKYSQEAAEYTTQKNELEASLSEANSRIASAKDKFRQRTRTQSIEISEILFQAADSAAVTITELGCSPPQEEEINGITYHVFLIDITAKASAREIVSLLNFSNKISDGFSTAATESVEITVPPEAEEEEGQEMPSMELRLKIYFYEGE